MPLLGGRPFNVISKERALGQTPLYELIVL